MATTAAEQLKTELEQGHWENYAELGLQNEAPPIYILRTGEKRRYINQGINLTNEQYSPEYTYAGTKIVTDPTVFVEIYATTKAIRDAMFDDMETIIEDSDYDITLKNVLPLDYKKRYRYECIATILKS